MPTIVDFPTVVQEALAVFGEVFDTEPARRHFAEYLTGLIVAENKTVSGINRTFALTTDQSCLNRWLTEVHWEVAYLGAAEIVSRPLPIRLREVNQPVIRTRNRFSSPRSCLLTCL